VPPSPTSAGTPAERHQPLADLFGALVGSIGGVLQADPQTMRLAVACVVAGGHLLIEDLPGLGKTTLAKALARSLGLEFRRLQMTADILPADIVGAMVLDLQRREPVFRRGPLFTNVLMADELNRASARAQSALLEAMEERQVTVDGRTYPLPEPFVVVATQNPYDAAGTSPLPHGQRDRFLLRISLGYPARAGEDALLSGADPSVRAGALPPVLTASDLGRLTEAVAAVHLAPLTRSYVLDLVEATRAHPEVEVGASPRAARSLAAAARAMALAAGRTYVTPADVQEVAVPTLAHRLVLRPGAELQVGAAESVVAELLERVPLPPLDSDALWGLSADGRPGPSATCDPSGEQSQPIDVT
jgi:MoxR-like ATPase